MELAALTNILSALYTAISFFAIVALIARSKDRNWFPWGLYGVFFFPIALTHAIVSKSIVWEEDLKTCPFCLEDIAVKAAKCKFCTEDQVS